MSKGYLRGRLGYNMQNQRYGLLVMDCWEVNGFSWGQPLEVKVNGRWKKTRMEMDWSTGQGLWYLVDTPYFANLEYIEARVEK